MIRDKKQLAELEERYLADYAVLSAKSSGRMYEEPEDILRLCFQKDRDRIIHSRAFRRLAGKTQVFVSGYGDHFRNRMSHSLEVSQVSRDICSSLGLNQDLAEAIALAHDLGHTPYGHAGEETLNVIMQKFGLHYEHNEQSKRIVEELEEVYPTFRGLNLTKEVREGLMKHKSSWDNIDKEFNYLSLEAQVVNLADEIAYQAHDVDDGLRSGILQVEELNDLAVIKMVFAKVKDRFGARFRRHMLRNRVVSMLISLMISDVLNETAERIDKNAIKTLDDVKAYPEVLVSFGETMKQANLELKTYLYNNFYLHEDVLEQSQRGQKILGAVFELLYNNPDLLPEKLRGKIDGGERKEIVVKDYVAGMTDDFAAGFIEKNVKNDVIASAAKQSGN